MKKQIEDALKNITIVTSNARMTREEHAQLFNDIALIQQELQSKEAKKDKKK